MFGAGKYDLECTAARRMAAAQGAILIIFNGHDGHGFSAQLPALLIAQLPHVLREVAAQIEQDATNLSPNRQIPS